MLKRTITGFFILLITAGFVALREVSLLFFDAFVLVLMYGCLAEVALANKFSDKKFSKIPLFLYPAALAVIYILSTSTEMALLLQVAAALLVFVVVMAEELIRAAVERKNGTAVNTESEQNQKLLSRAISSMQIVGYPLNLIGFLFGINHFGLNLGYVAIIMVFAITMMTDVFAYLIGVLFKGKKKMAPEISPKKTVVGMIGGIFGGLAAAALCYVLFAHLGLIGNVFKDVSLAKVISLFALSGVFGTLITQFGDLAESALKRKAGIKDSGNVFPGHGGFMDRVDGLMFTAALIYVLFALFI